MSPKLPSASTWHLPTTDLFGMLTSCLSFYLNFLGAFESLKGRMNEHSPALSLFCRVRGPSALLRRACRCSAPDSFQISL